MRNRFDRQLEELNNEMIQMGTLIEQAIADAVDALVNQNVEMARTAIEEDDTIDSLERSIEHLCLKLLLQQQPVAKDLRQISAALKMITDMERIGDHAADISEITIALSGQPYIKKLEHIQEMAKETIGMVTSSVDAFVEKDLELAKAVLVRDDIVDNYFLEVKRDIISLVTKDPAEGEFALDFLMIAKYLERIGDHATNIAEWVIYCITGVHEEV